MKDGPAAFQKYVPPTPFDWSKNPDHKRPKAYFSLVVDKEPIGRLVFELADDVVPKTVENFTRLCNPDNTLTYKGTKLHHVMHGSIVVGGDAELRTGAGSHSAMGTRYFTDENFIIPHSARGLLRCVCAKQ